MRLYVTALGGILFLAANSLPAAPLSGQQSANQGTNDSGASAPACDQSVSGSPYIPVDSWIYPAVWRLYSLGFLDNVYLGLRPWTRASLRPMLGEAEANLEDAGEEPVTDEARKLYEALTRELDRDSEAACVGHGGEVRVESTYTVIRAISGTPMRDSYHLGSTIVNDYGRPYENGFNNYSGASGYAIAGRFSLYLRGEFQGAPSATGYSAALAQALSMIDGTSYTDPTTLVTNYFLPQSTIPEGQTNTITHGRFLEAYVSAQFLNHVFSFGKQDEWMGPAQGASFAYSNNAENIYAFHINRIEPLFVPGLSRLTGPFRYEFLVGPLRGHTLMPNPAYPGTATNPQPNVINPGNPWVHVEKVSFRPTENLEFGFSRTIIWGGEGHAPVTVANFLRGFFSTVAPSAEVKEGRTDPGARFSSFDFSYRLPHLRNWLTLYSDAEAHDEVNPIDAPQHSPLAPGLYLSHFPGAPRLDMRAEAAYTDPPIRPIVNNSQPVAAGQFEYWEQIEKQGYTNQGQIFGSWIGRQAKGGQAWITWHLSGNEWLQVGYRRQKTASDFIPGGTTLNDVTLQLVKRLGSDFELSALFSGEHYKAPIYLPGGQTVTSTSIQLTWFPKQKIRF
jgi:hypothetical protein